MGKKTLTIILLLSICLNLTGCSVFECMEAGSNTKKIAKNDIQTGMEKDELLKIMGTPNKIESTGQIEVWFYRVSADKEIEFENTKMMPFIIFDSKLKAIGWNTYNSVMRPS